MLNLKYFKLLLKKIHSYSILARLGIFILALLIIWLPFAIPIYLILEEKDPNLTTILTMGILFIIFLVLVKYWGKYIYNNDHIFRTYGLVGSRKNLLYLLRGLFIGFSFTWLLFALEGVFGWVVFQPPNMPFTKLILEGFLSAIAIGFAEELFFRGWLLAELEKDFSISTSSWINALVFALLHFLKPITEIISTLVAFCALALLGICLVWAKQSHQNLLGIAIGLHGGLVWGYYVLNVGQMITYTEVVPQWITGINQNPIAGLMGLIFLAILSYLMKEKSNPNQTQ